VTLTPARSGGAPGPGAATGVSKAANPWPVLAVAFWVSVAAMMAQFAVPPLMPVLMEAFRVDIHQASATMSIFSITGLLLALPAGLVLQRFGAIATGGVAMAAVIVGCTMAALTRDFGILLVSRAVQGVGVGLVGVAAPAVVAAVFPPERRGLPMGIWAMWVPVGGVLMYLLAPALAQGFGWPWVFWTAAAAAASGLVAYVTVLRRSGVSVGGGAVSAAGHDLRRALAGRDIWLLSALFALFACATSVPNNFTTTYLVQERGYTLSAAALVSATVLAGAGVGSVAAGLVSDRIGSRRRVLVTAFALFGLFLAVPFAIAGPAEPIAFLAVGICLGAVPAVTFASVPELVGGHRLAGGGMAAVMLGQNGGFVIGPIAFAALVPALGWAGAALAFAVLAEIGAMLGTRLRLR
jgi:MFS family permease